MISVPHERRSSAGPHVHEIVPLSKTQSVVAFARQSLFSEAALPRQRKHSTIKLAMSSASWADALDIRPDEVAEGINGGALPVYVMGIKRRILASDVEVWVRSWPQQSKRKRKVSP